MAFNTKVGDAGTTSALDGLVDQLDLGAGGALIRIYAGTQPADPDVAVTTQTLLAELTCSTTAFGNASATASGATAAAAAITDDTSANASGTATWFRAVAGDTGNTPIIDGSVGTTASNDMVLNSTSIATGATVSITAWTITFPNG